MRIAITRAPGPELARCELTHLARQPIDFERACLQHRAYQDVLRQAGFRVISLPADPDLPDGVFVEDTAVVLDEIAVITSPTPLSRRREWPAIESELMAFRSIARLPAGVNLEGGDVLRMGQRLFVGISERTSATGAQALADIVRPYGYAVVPVRVTGCLHLKSACAAIDGETALVNRDWIDADALSGIRFVDLPRDEPWGANVLRLPKAVLVSSAFPRTNDLVAKLDYLTLSIDVSELHKAEAGLTCMSLLMDS